MKTILIAAALLLAGCSNMGQYYASVDAANVRQVEVAKAHAEAESVRYQALMRIAESGDATAKVAATMALAFGGQGQRTTQTVTPSVPQNEALQWASIIVPGVTQGMSIYYNAQTSMRSSDNATRLGLSTNATFGQFASEIAKDPLVVTQPDPVIVTQPEPVIVPPTVVNPVVVDPVVVTVP